MSIVNYQDFPFRHILIHKHHPGEVHPRRPGRGIDLNGGLLFGNLHREHQFAGNTENVQPGFVPPEIGGCG